MGEKKRHDNLRGVVDEVTKKLIDEGKIIEAGWMAFRILVLPDHATQIQLTDMRAAFFSGAQHLFGSMMSTLDEDTEPTEADLERMSKISEELDRFINEFKLHQSKTEGSV